MRGGVVGHSMIDTFSMEIYVTVCITTRSLFPSISPRTRSRGLGGEISKTLLVVSLDLARRRGGG